MPSPSSQKGKTGVMPKEQPGPNVDIVIDCAEPEALARLWSAALGYRSVGFGDPYVLLLPAQRAYPPVVLQRVPEPKQGKRPHPLRPARGRRRSRSAPPGG